MAIKSYKTGAPTGVTIKRNGNLYTFSWKCGNRKGYRFQRAFFQVHYGGKWHTVKEWKKFNGDVRKLSWSLNPNNYYPNPGKPIISNIRFKIYGWGRSYTIKRKAKKKGKTSSTTYTYTGRASSGSAKVLKLLPPPTPKLTVTASGELHNNTEVTWTNENIKGDNNRPYFETRYQSKWAINGADGIDWNGAEESKVIKESSKTYTEPTAGLSNPSYARWFRMKTCGMAGDSSWISGKHVYVKPPIPSIGDVNLTSLDAAMRVTVNWSVAASSNYPVDSSWAEWAMVTPGAALTCPQDATFEQAQSYAEAKTPYEFDTARLLGDDEALFVRMAVKHDENISYSKTKFIEGGKLKAPTLSNVETSVSGGILNATLTVTHESEVADSGVDIIYRSNLDMTARVVGHISKSDTTGSVSIRLRSGETDYDFGIIATREGFNQSAEVWHGGNVPQAPTGVTAKYENDGITVSWVWGEWEDADGAQLSWADRPDAWESTDEPQTHDISHIHASRWRITGLEKGKRWYVRVRLKSGENYGSWSDMVAVNLSETPIIPDLTLSASAVTAHDSFVASWGYVSQDGTGQKSGQICEAVIDGNNISYITNKKGEILTLASTESAQSIPMSIEGINAIYEANGLNDKKWLPGSTHYLASRVESLSGLKSDGWSSPKAINIVTPIEVRLKSTLLDTFPYNDIFKGDGETAEFNLTYNGNNHSVTVDGINAAGTTISESVLTFASPPADGARIVVEYTARGTMSLRSLPMRVTVRSNAENENVTLILRRAENYFLKRPDERISGGFNGETAYMSRLDGKNPGEGAVFEITQDQLISPLDDGAKYEIVATVTDGFGQKSTATQSFIIVWDHQPNPPTCEVLFDSMKHTAQITPTAPAGAAVTDRCDIYRLSVDKPELIIENGEFGTTYIDPYPAFGETSGYRVVTKTAYGDYIAPGNNPAWIDTNENANAEYINSDRMVIDFANDQIELKYNIGFENNWNKDFERTQYLGGSIIGEWNNGIIRDMDASAEAVIDDKLDAATTIKLRRLADYLGVCHIRTSDGSSFACNISVSEGRSFDSDAVAIKLKAEKVDVERLDGLTLEEWETLK